MNYGYSFQGDLCFDPGTGQYLKTINYSGDGLPVLSESSLSEFPTSSFSTALQARSCDAAPGFVPVFWYGCNGDEDIDYVVESDGTQITRRIRQGSAWQNSSLPAHDPGIDWNCDDDINEGAVSENINGDGASGWFNNGSSNDLLPSRDDWANIPFHAGTACFSVQDPADLFPEDYLNAMARPDCLIDSMTGSSTLTVEPGVQPGQPFPPPHEDTFVNDIAPINNLEVCNGRDDDNDLAVDEGCLDTDDDDVVDAIDNCRETPNPEQIDADGDHLGDACSAPVLTSLIVANQTSKSITLTWTGTTTDVLGFNVYRQLAIGQDLVLLGNSYPSSNTDSFTDEDFDPNGDYFYYVHPVNMVGQEQEGLTITVGSPYRIYLPAIAR